MKLIKGAWKILVGIKDALVLALLLLFFGALFAALQAQPDGVKIHDGALLLALDGTIVEQPEEVDPIATLTGGDVANQYRLRDVVRALDEARDDDRVKAVVLDLDRFMGGYPAAISDVADAVQRVRDSGKPVLAYATAYTDSGYRLAAAASEIWTNPMGGVLLRGPGGSQLYYKGLIDKLGINAHVYRVGTYKSAVEPYIRENQSGPAREAAQLLYGTIFDQWKQGVAQDRPQARIEPFLTDPAATVQAADGDLAQANLRAKLVDHLGDRIAFGKRVAKIVGADDDKPVGSFKAIDYDDWVQVHPLSKGGPAIGVITVAGEIVDGTGGPGTAAGDTIARLILDGLDDKKLKALVVRVDSPGGSALASEHIREAILQAKAKGLPVVVSMGSVAASGGYWVSTAGDAIFAEPDTITGSIGIFGIIPTFEDTLDKIGVNADGVKTTPLSGQPDVLAGTSDAFDRILQAQIESGYRKFVGLVATSRNMTPARVDEIGQGRVWPGGIARQIGLVDRFGGIHDAIAEAARRAKLDPDKVHAVYLEKEPSKWAKLIEQFARQQDDDEDSVERGSADLFSRLAAERRATLAQAIGDARRLAQGGSVQARCLECTAFRPAAASAGDVRLLDLILTKIWQ
ncbi:signal peptide peptidase SppA [Stakelama saccharophila]|uniref:Signal peptide peptidase SppA n=1 Tax=Stakelama saccharophila TaxID=3075605 RepID=A0ABZ0BDA5_9SPHN|nr:signal peptide peptidase SppA [Stakelama sp. W311]WNO55105.1 signal peptide peptidase SppA [Stakelama sp. W311]